MRERFASPLEGNDKSSDVSELSSKAFRRTPSCPAAQPQTQNSPEFALVSCCSTDAMVAFAAKCPWVYEPGYGE